MAYIDFLPATQFTPNEGHSSVFVGGPSQSYPCEPTSNVAINSPVVSDHHHPPDVPLQENTYFHGLMSEPMSAHPMVTKSKAGTVKPNPRYSLTTAIDDVSKPLNVKQALSHSGWLKAIQDELAAPEANDTWELVPHTTDMNIIGTKWVFKLSIRLIILLKGSKQGSLPRDIISKKVLTIQKHFHLLSNL